MISADVAESINKILPVDQNLIPVSFKKKMEYKGHFLQEYIDKNKVLEYYNWYKLNNHLFQDYELDQKLIEDYESRSMEAVKKIDEEKSLIWLKIMKL